MRTSSSIVPSPLLLRNLERAPAGVRLAHVHASCETQACRGSAVNTAVMCGIGRQGRAPAWCEPWALRSASICEAAASRSGSTSWRAAPDAHPRRVRRDVHRGDDRPAGVAERNGDGSDAFLDLLVDEGIPLRADVVEDVSELLGIGDGAIGERSSRASARNASRSAGDRWASSTRPFELACARNRVPTGTETVMIRFAGTRTMSTTSWPSRTEIDEDSWTCATNASTCGVATSGSVMLDR